MSAKTTKPPKWVRVYFIRVQIRTAYNGLFERDDWRAYRTMAVWPRLFPSRAEAERFMQECFTFKNIPGRKHSASVDSKRIKLPLTIRVRDRTEPHRKDLQVLVYGG